VLVTGRKIRDDYAREGGTETIEDKRESTLCVNAYNRGAAYLLIKGERVNLGRRGEDKKKFKRRAEKTYA